MDVSNFQTTLSALNHNGVIHALIVVNVEGTEYSRTACNKHLLTGTVDADLLTNITCKKCRLFFRRRPVDNDPFV